MTSGFVEALYNWFDRFHSKKIKRFYTKGEQENTPDFLFDVGGHKGEFVSLTMTKNIPIVMFEPQTGFHGTIRENLVGFNLLDIHNYALSNQEGRATFFINELSSTSSLSQPNDESFFVKFKTMILGGKLIGEKKEVDIKKLDNVIESEKYFDLGFENALLKIDVEGHEYNVLEGAKNLLNSGRIKFVQIESASFKVYKDADSDPKLFLEEMGFELKKSFLFPLLNFSDLIFVKKE